MNLLNNNCNDNRKNQRNNFIDFPNLNVNSSNNGSNQNNNANLNNKNNNNNNLHSNQNNHGNMNNFNNDCIKFLTQILLQNQNNNNNCNNSLNSLNNSLNNNNNNSNNNNNMNNLFNLNNNCNNPNGIPDFLKASNLISELIKLEQQNRIQIDLIQKIIDTKYKNNASINNVLINMLTNEEPEKHDYITTKSSSKSSDNSNKNMQNNFGMNAINNSTFNIHQNEFKLEEERGNYLF